MSTPAEDPDIRALREAAAKDDPAAMRSLLDAGASPSTVLDMRRGLPVYAIDIALTANAIETALALVEAGSPVSTPFHPDMASDAAWNVKLLPALLQRGCPVSQTSANPNAIVSTCSMWGDAASMRRVLDSGLAPRDARIGRKPAFDGDCAVHPLVENAAGAWNTGTLRVLLEYGFDVAARQDDGRTAMHLAAYGSYARNGKQPQERQRVTVEALLEAGLDIDVRDDNGDTPLWYALTNGLAGTASLLLNMGADPDARDAAGNDYRAKLQARVEAKTMRRIDAESLLQLLNAAKAGRALRAGIGSDLEPRR